MAPRKVNCDGLSRVDSTSCRSSKIGYDPDGLFPTHHTNPAGHLTVLGFDERLGVVTRITDPNGLVTEHRVDGFGRLGLERHPDGTETQFHVTRTRDGGPANNAWRVRERTVTTGGADEEVEHDSRGRVVQRWWFGASPSASPEPDSTRLTQWMEYDARTGQLARRSVPVRESAAGSASKVLFDVLERDDLGREVRHVAPWGGVTTYTYGPFGRLVRVVGPDGAVTKTTFDALGRTTKSEDPDRGTTVWTHNGFGEVVGELDALGRETTFERDAMGRLTQRVDELAGMKEVTTWKWDSAAHGIGALHEAASPDATKTYTYDALARVESVALEVAGEPSVLQGKLGYDALGRVESLSYPAPGGAAPFAVKQRYDAHGALREVKDLNSPLVYWQLTAVDDAGRIRTEEMGNGAAATNRTYFADRQRLRSITTESATGVVQSLHYTWDARLHLRSRSDDLQPKNRTERFRYDALERLTCSYFAPQEDMSAPCAWSYDYDAAGNLTYKSDVGSLDYGDAAHPHAVTKAGGATYGYDAAGHQTMRPGGMGVEYTPFDLPRKVTVGSAVRTFGYDADQRRVRKSTPTEETLYFDDLYERATDAGTGEVTHRYRVHSAERVIAQVTRTGSQTEIAYLHADHLGSVDAITDGAGNVTERRSYDAFGQRRNPTWGAPPPMSYSSTATLGYAGHETDDDLGLVPMRGRMFDPRIGRFLTTDRVVSDRFFSQAWNPYAYVLNSPLTYTDPTGWEGEPEREPTLPVGPDGFIEITVPGLPRIGPPEPPNDDPTDNAQIGVAAPSSDTDTTGSTPDSGTDPEDPDDSPGWTQHPVAQVIGGFWSGTLLGLVPFAGAGEELAEAGGVVGRGTPAAQRGKAIGLILGGTYTMVSGAGGELFGGAATATGVGAPVGMAS
ncbi:MAG: RHS repeat-associated core domain-containing protein, partial [Polyangiaceae bacterium]